MAGGEPMAPENTPDELAALVAAAAALRAASTPEAGLQAIAEAAGALRPGAVARALVFLGESSAGGEAAPGDSDRRFDLAAAQPARPPGGAPPGAALAEAADAPAPRWWSDPARGDEWMLVPLRAGGVRGVLALGLAVPLAPGEAAPWQLLAQFGVQALELLRLRQEAGRGDVESSLLDRVSTVVNSSLSLDAILAEILAHLATIIPFDGGSIALINPAQELEIRALYGWADEAARAVRVPVGEGISGWVAAQGRPYLSNDLDAEQAIRPVARATGSNRRFGAYMAVPLLVDGRAIGILQVNSAQKNVFRARDLALLAEVGSRCALAVDRARLFGEMEARARRLGSLNEIARRLSAALDLDELFRTCYEQVRRVMPADAFLVALYDAAAALVRYEFLIDLGEVAAKSAMPLDEGLTSYVIRTRRPLRVGARGALPVQPVAFGQRGRASESLLMVPLIFEGRVLGAMSAQAYRREAYTPDDLDLLATIANQAAVAVRNAQLWQSERDAQQAREEFLSLVSHELRTPLTAIKGAAQVIQRRMLRAFSAGQVQTPAEQAARRQDVRQLAQIVRQVDRLNALVNDLLDVSRLQSGRFEFHPEPADLAAVLQQVVEASRGISAEHRLVFTGPATLPGTFDALRIEQVLTNLIGNALKYAPDGTEVAVTAALVAPGLALVQVRDAGPGLDPADQARLFERFYRGVAVRSNPRTGLGLGLYISRQIVEWHGGRIWVESTPGAGSTFQFTLPLEPAAEESRS